MSGLLHGDNAPVLDAAAARGRCLRYRKRILDMSQNVGALHAAPAFSCMEIVDLVYHALMRWSDERDTPDAFVMSKGHGCVSQYVILEDMGILETADIEAYCTPTGRLGAHPDYGVPGIFASTGSLGHGMGIATGMAYAEKLQRRDGNVYLVLSDGECQEGSTWEAAMMAANKSLGNLIAFVDLNDFSGLERMSEAHKAFYPLKEKFETFGWETASVNGHDAAAMYAAIQQRDGDKPFVAVCETVKGKGVSYMEHVPIWHYRSPNPDEYAQALAELEEISG
ncbi:MAG: transketolase [Pseudomonadota bacterium]